ncbi:hypothetical protein [Tuwongella immobilis]|uniref:Uncharacterized protein n=1 Tax=Tuwongella immobilis TaxID=692036 RepID=A0A6C2YPT2_9BACT|nr:hypothetical protein [Tuwongella immobilis]VIP03357.1 Uncharacterized protein OS=Tolypothrix bouteillei VB521301 GN=DA73_45910 PE=4 SV=1 [Tuwongella immobilis]VTS04086.1 Uncharacterized protein OS=Tolypothrix bouteillei VB521301 GN=DA73_45910 PE=4 SV=1 [Tuwongella immobilis]
MSLRQPLTVPEAVSTTQQLIVAIDSVLTIGIGRLGPEQTETLSRLTRIATGSPLEVPIRDAIEAIGRNEFQDKHFLAIAAFRVALQGAIADRLRHVAAESLGRPSPACDDPQPIHPAPIDGPVGSRQEATRNWLMELAIAGFQNLDASTVDPFLTTLERLQDEPAAARLAALLTGFVGELNAALPLTDSSVLPTYRWCDLWSRAFVLASRSLESAAGSQVHGTFFPMGVDLRHHGFVVQAEVYGILESPQAEWVRVPVASYKVDVLVGPEMLRSFESRLPQLWEALKSGKSLQVSDAVRLPGGLLRLDGELKLGSAIDFTALTDRFAVGAENLPKEDPLPGADRHPLLLAEPVTLTGVSVLADSPARLKLPDGSELAIATKRISPSSELNVSNLTKMDRVFGLLRFDGKDWSIQPLIASLSTKKNSEIRTGSSILDATAKKKGDTLEQLQERASRLLRAKPSSKTGATP